MHHHISKTMENSKCKPLDPQKILMKWSESFAIFMDHCYSVRFLEVSCGFFLISDMDNSSFSRVFFLWFSMCNFFLCFSQLLDGVQCFSYRFPTSSVDLFKSCPCVFHLFSMFFPWFSMFSIGLPPPPDLSVDFLGPAAAGCAADAAGSQDPAPRGLRKVEPRKRPNEASGSWT